MADYHQVVVADAAAAPDFAVAWDAAALDARMALGKGWMVVATERDMPVPVRVTLYERDPEGIDDLVDHAVLGHLLTHGDVVIAGLNDYWPTATHLTVPAGWLWARWLSIGLSSLSADGLEGDDRYEMQFWPATSEGGAQPMILKNRAPD
ncbi:hypothetical protein [Rhizobium halophytocola]|uniref:Uncharacterized protein n=1 Tax=Rhizobium halophytocola TaxID=735519 RepID=A0ABS4DTJ4_9HYPH|nr:hypothetical protein [Rhizobium halophytocola]MBP1849005.1 hypothetical protein [Rhizobium halophytocola]